MATRAVAALAIALVLSGCTPVHRMDPVASGSELDELNRALGTHRVSVGLVGGVPDRPGGTLRAESVRVAADSTSLTILREPSDFVPLWSERSYGAKRDTTLSTLAIHTLSVRRHGWGAVKGFMYGLVIGATLFGVGGAGVGLIAGTIRGAAVIYELPVTPPRASVRRGQ